MQHDYIAHHLVRLHFVVYLLYADLPGTNIPALGTKVPHSCQCQFTQIPMLHSRCHQGHGDVPVDQHELNIMVELLVLCACACACACACSVLTFALGTP